MTKVVVVEDERDIVEVLEFNLRAEGYEVSSATSGREGLALVENTRPDLLIVDLMLPDISGNEICRAVRASSQGKQMPILILSARGEEIDRVVGFELGADDYVTKPFSVRELMLRVRALVRRSHTGSKKQPDESIVFGPLRIDRQAHRLWVNGEEITLTALEFKLLVTLFERRNRVQTRVGLLEHVWGIHAHISTRTVDAHVKRLREKLGDARDYVETVRGVGYRFKEDPTEDQVGSEGAVGSGPSEAARVSDLY
jgi:two-component system, OmpR family, phosphate regulon response regulator PhoB